MPSTKNRYRGLRELNRRRAGNRVAIQNRAGKHSKVERAKSAYYNIHGHAKTADFYLRKGSAKNANYKFKGRGVYQRWTPESILKTGSFNPTSSLRSNCPEKTSAATVIHCSKMLAKIVHSAQRTGLTTICNDSRNRELDFYITNNMSDETRLPLGFPRTRKSSCLAWHSQVTYKEGGAGNAIHDHDIIRPPRHLKSYKAATLWKIMALEDDSAGLRPCGGCLPQAKYIGILTANDSHAVNKLLSKYVSQNLKPNEYHLMCLCMHHRVGS